MQQDIKPDPDPEPPVIENNPLGIGIDNSVIEHYRDLGEESIIIPNADDIYQENIIEVPNPDLGYYTGVELDFSNLNLNPQPVFSKINVVGVQSRDGDSQLITVPFTNFTYTFNTPVTLIVEDRNALIAVSEEQDYYIVVIIRNISGAYINYTVGTNYYYYETTNTNLQGVLKDNNDVDVIKLFDDNTSDNVHSKIYLYKTIFNLVLTNPNNNE